MHNCHHFPLSLQFLYHSLSDLHNRTHLSRTVCHALERNLQNLISKDKIRFAEIATPLGYQVIGIDLNVMDMPWNVLPKLWEIKHSLKENYNSISLRANSIGC